MAKLLDSRMRKTLEDLEAKDKKAKEKIEGHVKTLVRVLHEIEMLKVEVAKNMKDAIRYTCMIEDILERWAVRVEAAWGRKIGTKNISILERCFRGHDCSPPWEEDINHMADLLGSPDRFKGLWRPKAEEELANLFRKIDAYLTQLNRSVSGMYDIEEHFVRKEDLEILKSLVKEKRLLALCGATGMGKTSLAGRLYNDAEVRAHFKAFACVSFTQHPESTSLLRNIRDQLVAEEQKRKSDAEKRKSDDEKRKSDDEKQQLIKELKQIQGRKECFIILDNISATNQWEDISSAFDCTRTGILLTPQETTTIPDTVSHEQPGADKVFYKLKPLNEEQGWKLLQKHAFCGKRAPEKGIAPKLGKQMLHQCEGLPLNIYRLGRILSQKPTSEWHKVNKDVKQHLQGEDNQTQSNEKPDQVSFPNYDQLNFHKKQCFLFLAVFKENEYVDSEDLKFLWMAEGMVYLHHLPTMDEAEPQEETMNEAKQQQSTMERTEPQEETMNEAKQQQSMMEIIVPQEETMNEAKQQQSTIERTALQQATMDIAEDYVQEMADKLAANGRFKPLHLRKEVRELSLHYGEKDGFRLMVLDFSGGQQPIFWLSSFVRRLAIHFNKLSSSLEKDALDGIPRLRSLFFLNSDQEYTVLPVRISDFKEFELLRVLHFVRCKFHDRKLPQGIDELLNLRYLGVLYCDLDGLPESLTNVRNLHTLNVRAYHDAKITIPDSTYEMARLKHLRLPYNSGDDQSTMPRHRENSVHEQPKKLKLEGLQDLESLDGFNADIHDVKSLSRLEKLRHLVAYANSNDSLESVIEFAKGKGDRVRTKLYVESQCNFTSEEGLEILQEVLMCPNLHSLTLSMARVDEFPNCGTHASEHLTEIRLIGCKLSKDPMEALGNFPKLQKLCLGYGAFVGKVMTIDDKGFPKLEYLELSCLSNLEEWRVAKGAMKILLAMTVKQCPNLNQSTFASSLKNLRMVSDSEERNNGDKETRRYLKKSHRE